MEAGGISKLVSHFEQISTSQTVDKKNSLGVTRNPPQTTTTAKSDHAGQTIQRQTANPLTAAQKNMAAHRAKLQHGGTGRLHEIIGGNTSSLRAFKQIAKEVAAEHQGAVDHQKEFGAIEHHEDAKQMQQTEQSSQSAPSHSPAATAQKSQEVFHKVVQQITQEPPKAELKLEIRGLSKEKIEAHKDAIDAVMKELKGSDHAIKLVLDDQHFVVYSKETGGAQAIKFKAFSGITKFQSGIEFEGFIAKGAKGIIQRATDAVSSGLKALKTATGVKNALIDANNDVKNEHAVLTKLHKSHPQGRVPGLQKAPRLVHLGLEEGMSEEQFGTLTHFYGGGDLDKNLDKLSKQELLTGFENIAAGLTFMHSQNMAHQDIKAANIFIEEGKFYLGDFGEVQANFEESLVFTGGTPAFKSDYDQSLMGQLEVKYKNAPTEEKEAVIAERHELAKAMDTFALGITLLGAAMGRKASASGMPFTPYTTWSGSALGKAGLNNTTPKSSIKMGPRGKNLPVLTEGCSPEMKTLLEGFAKKQHFTIDAQDYHRIIAEKEASLGDAAVKAFKDLAKAPPEMTEEGKQSFAVLADKYGSEFSDLVLRMVDVDPTKRPSATEIQTVIGQIKAKG